MILSLALSLKASKIPKRGEGKVYSEELDEAICVRFLLTASLGFSALRQARRQQPGWINSQHVSEFLPFPFPSISLLHISRPAMAIDGMEFSLSDEAHVMQFDAFNQNAENPKDVRRSKHHRGWRKIVRNFTPA